MELLRVHKGDAMKLIKILTAFIALVSLQIAAAQWLNVPSPAEARNLMVVGGGVPVASGQAASYAGANINSSTGNVTTNTGTDAVNGVIAWNDTFTCPGTGTRVIDSMDVYASVPSSTYAFRLALYTSAGNFVGQTAETNITDTTATWQLVTSFLNQAKAALSPLNCTGGSSYTLAIGTSSASVAVVYGTTAGGSYNATEVCNAGFPSTLPAPTASNENFAVRIHVAEVTP
jgi:hypothetical protein